MLTAVAQIFWLLMLGLIPAILAVGVLAALVPTMLMGYALVKGSPASVHAAREINVN